MAVEVLHLSVKTDSSGNGSVTRRLYGVVRAVAISVGSLASTADVTVTDHLSGTNVLTVANVAADSKYLPQVVVQDAADGSDLTTRDYPVVLGSVTVAVAQGGDTKEGTVHLLVEQP